MRVGLLVSHEEKMKVEMGRHIHTLEAWENETYCVLSSWVRVSVEKWGGQSCARSL